MSRLRLLEAADVAGEAHLGPALGTEGRDDLVHGLDGLGLDGHEADGRGGLGPDRVDGGPVEARGDDDGAEGEAGVARGLEVTVARAVGGADDDEVDAARTAVAA